MCLRVCICISAIAWRCLPDFLLARVNIGLWCALVPACTSESLYACVLYVRAWAWKHAHQCHVCMHVRVHIHFMSVCVHLSASICMCVSVSACVFTKISLQARDTPRFAMGIAPGLQWNKARMISVDRLEDPSCLQDPRHWQSKRTVGLLEKEKSSPTTSTISANAKIYTSIHTCLHTYVRTYVLTYIRKYLRTDMQTYRHTNTHTHIRTDIHTYRPTDGRADRRADGRTDGQTDRQTK